jgi:medium-chain acyl-[acyl-carrier-protein] hydrolase
MHALPDDEFRAALTELGGAAPEVLASDDLITYLIDCLRADFTLWEQYVYQPRPPLDCPITVFGGDKDQRVTLGELAEWRAHTTEQLRLQVFDGGHFFVTDRAAEVTREIANVLSPVAPAGWVR